MIDCVQMCVVRFRSPNIKLASKKSLLASFSLPLFLGSACLGVECLVAHVLPVFVVGVPSVDDRHLRVCPGAFTLLVERSRVGETREGRGCRLTLLAAAVSTDHARTRRTHRLSQNRSTPSSRTMAALSQQQQLAQQIQQMSVDSHQSEDQREIDDCLAALADCRCLACVCVCCQFHPGRRDRRGGVGRQRSVHGLERQPDAGREWTRAVDPRRRRSSLRGGRAPDRAHRRHAHGHAAHAHGWVHNGRRTSQAVRAPDARRTDANPRTARGAERECGCLIGTQIHSMFQIQRFPLHCLPCAIDFCQRGRPSSHCTSGLRASCGHAYAWKFNNRERNRASSRWKA